MVLGTLEKKYVHSNVFNIFVEHAARTAAYEKDKDILVERLNRLRSFCEEYEIDLSFLGARGILSGVTTSKLAESRIKVVEEQIKEHGYFDNWQNYKKSNPINGD